MIHQIKTILTPVRLYSVEEFLNIAVIVNNDFYAKNAMMKMADKHTSKATAFNILTRYEEMTRGKWVVDEMPTIHSTIDVEAGSFSLGKHFQPALLTKEMFVCEVDKPNDGIDGNDGHGCVTEQDLAHEAAKKKVWFEGFDKFDNNSVTNGSIAIWFNKRAWIEGRNGSTLDAKLDTVYDLIYQLDKHNNKSLTHTDSFVEALIKR